MAQQFEDLAAPDLGEPLPPAHPSADARRLMWLRRSTTADRIGAPGPDAATLERLLTIASRAPDHRRVTPFRFIVFEGDARAKAGDALADAFVKANPDAEREKIEFERGRFLRTPLVVCVVSVVNEAHRTPAWEQILTAGAVCQNLLIAANAFGFASQWLTEWYAYDEGFLARIGVASPERVAGFVYLGTAQDQPLERARPDVGALLTRFGDG